MSQDHGIACGPGSREPDQQAVPALRASIPNAGDWVLFRRAGGYEKVKVEIRQAEKVTAKVIRFVGTSWPRQCSILEVGASFPDKGTALRVRDAIGGVAGEFERRRRAAEEDKSRRVTEALAAANEQVRRIIASAMSARQGRDPEEGLGAKPASAGPKGDAQQPPEAS